jgi:hypothetical protein
LTATLPEHIEPRLPRFDAPPGLPDPSDAASFEDLKQKAPDTAKESDAKADKGKAQKRVLSRKGSTDGTGVTPGGKGTRGTGGNSDGTSGLPGGRRPKTPQEFLAERWRFDLSGDGAEHANKLVAMGVTVAVAAADGKVYAIRDLKKRPVDLVPLDRKEHRDEVKWYNPDANSLRSLAAVLQLPFVPRHVILFLPKERETQMAALEREAMQRQGRQTVHATWFDFRLRNGAYEPFVTRLE